MAGITDIARKILIFCFLLLGIVQNGLGILQNKQERDISVTSLHVVSDIKFRFATTMVSSRIKNYANDSRKAIFNVTMPNEAFVTEFQLTIGGIIYTGEIKDKRAAREQFENAVSMGETAGYLGTRERDTNQFFIEVNLAAYDKVTFNLTYQELLTRKDGHYDHQIYVDAGRSVEDMSITVDLLEYNAINLFEAYAFGNKIERNDVNFDIRDEDPSITAIFTPSHNVRRVQYIPSKEDMLNGLTGQFIVRYDVRRSSESEVLVVGGHFIHFFAPAGLEPIPRNVLFILDISGSMFGAKIQQLKTAMHIILDDLNNDDKFNILTFSHETTKWRENMASKTIKNINNAKTFVDKLEADGGTNIFDALQEGLIQADILSRTSTRSTIIFFLTDGEPTDGSVTNKTEIMTRVQKMNQDSNRTPIFTLAFGYGADYKLMRKIALQNYGLARRIYEAGDAENQISGVYQEISNMLMKDVTIEYPENIDESSLTKTSFSNYFNGTEKVIAGKFRNSIENVQTVQLQYGSANGKRQEPLNLVLGDVFEMPGIANLTSKTDLEEIIEKSSAFLRVKQLIDDSESSVKDTEKGLINQQILDLSLRYGFVTPLTSMVVTKPPEVKKTNETEEEGKPYPRKDNLNLDRQQSSGLIDDTRTDSSSRNGLYSDLYSDDFGIVLDNRKNNDEPSLVFTVDKLDYPLCFNSLGTFDGATNGRVNLFRTEDGVIDIEAEIENKDVFIPTTVFVKTKGANFILRSWSVFNKESGKTSTWRNLTFGDTVMTKKESQLLIQIGEIEFSLESMVSNQLRIIVNKSVWIVPEGTKPNGILAEILSKMYRIKDFKDGEAVARIKYPDIDNDRGAKLNLHSLKSEMAVSQQCYLVMTNQSFFFEDFRNIPRYSMDPNEAIDAMPDGALFR